MNTCPPETCPLLEIAEEMLQTPSVNLMDWGPSWDIRIPRGAQNAKQLWQFRWQFKGNSKQFGPQNGNSASRRGVKMRKVWQFTPPEVCPYKTRIGGQSHGRGERAGRLLEFYSPTRGSQCSATLGPQCAPCARQKASAAQQRLTENAHQR